MKILTITSNDIGISWGPAIHFLELWNNLIRLDNDIYVSGLAPSWTGQSPIIDSLFSLKRIRVPNIKAWRQTYFDAVVAFYLLFTWWKFDLIYIRLSHWHFMQIVVLWVFRITFVVELNGLAQEDAASSGKNRIIRALVKFQERWLVSRASLVIAVSDGIASAVNTRYRLRGRVVVIKNGVAGQFFRDPGRREDISNQHVVVYVGTFTPWDGAAEVVRLAADFPDVEFLMVGDGRGKASIQDQSPPNVSFLGYVQYSRLPEIYQRATSAVVLYDYQRHQHVKLSSLKTLEYVASGLPVFTTAVPGQEFVENLGVGRLVKEHENVSSSFRKFLFELPKYYSAYENIGAELEKQIGWNSTARQTERAILALAARS